MSVSGLLWPTDQRLLALDALAAGGRITGYTLEPVPAYLSRGDHLLTYSVYGDDRTGRRNLGRLVRDLSRLDASITSHSRTGTVTAGADVRRTRELAVVAGMPGRLSLEAALDLVCELHAAGGSRPRAGSWQLPDVRICGSGNLRHRTVAAFAHELPVGEEAAVVITLDNRPPLAGMRSHPVRVLNCWAPYLAVAAG